MSKSTVTSRTSPILRFGQFAMPRDILVTTITIVVAVLLVGLGPHFLNTYTINVLIRSFLYAATALTVNILWGYTGILTFGQAAFFGIGAYGAGLIFTHVGFNSWLALLALVAGIAVAMVVAGLVGWFSFFQGSSPIYIAVVTLVLPIIVVQLLFSGGKFTGSSSGLVGYETFFLSMESWFWICGGGLILLTGVAWILVRGDLGRLLIAIRENEQRCTFLGLKTTQTKIITMMAMGAVAAIAGYGYACFTVVVSPEIAGFVFGTELLIWVALGGRGSLVGPVLGTIMIDYTSAYLGSNMPFTWTLIVGIIFVFVIVVLPKGLIPAVTQSLDRITSYFFRSSNDGVDPSPTFELLPFDPVTGRENRRQSEPLIKVDSLQRSYGSLKVLDGVQFEVYEGELLGIIGPNGAGKTTLMRCLSDGSERTSGEIIIDGVDVGQNPPQRVVGLGLGRSFQNTSLFEALTVGESLRIACSRHQPLALWKRERVLRLPNAALKVVRSTGLDEFLDLEVRYLSHGMKRALELSMVLSLEPRVLLLDEPTAGLTLSERQIIGDILGELVRDHQMCVLLIEHDLDFVRNISSRVIVLHQGHVVLDGRVDEVVNSDLVQAIYSGQPQAEART